ncbi:MAG: hypothetical protein MUF51_06000 [Vicinamibacteria bacterium]|jgi:16S rRNA (cytosine967-C5)-methyltransferase|nr:hypothetical protein [Vicinamibacteria bacterium]
MATTTRALALRILTKIESTATILSDLLADDDVAALPSRDRAFLHEVVMGTLRYRGALDLALGRCMDRALDQVKPPILVTILRLSAYQCLKMRVPQHAIVSEAVDLAHRHAPRAAGWVNAVLRALIRQGPPSPPDEDKEPLRWLTTEGSLPAWLAERWLARLGALRSIARARALLLPAPAVFRLNPMCPDAWQQVIDAGLDPVALSVPGSFLARGTALHSLAQQDVIHLQAQGSQMIAQLACRPRRILDVCAAPGGKSLTMSAQIGATGSICAMEISSRRLATLRGRISRWQCANVHCLGGDALRPPFGCEFDSVLLDAPCSGLGTLSRHPDIRYRSSLDAIARQAERQARMLSSVAPLVKRGGQLLYATCSLEPEEDSQVVSAFLEERRDFQVAELPDWTRPFHSGPFLEVTPEDHGGDGFFAAVLRRA